MKLLTSACLLMLAINSYAQEVSPVYKEISSAFLKDVKSKDPEFKNKPLLVIRQSFPYKLNNNNYDYGAPDFFKSYLDNINNDFPEKIYKKKKINNNYSVNIDSIEFNKEERMGLTKYFQENKPFTWTRDVLGDDVNIINSAAIDSHYNRKDIKGNMPGYPRDYFRLSAPYFLKNSTVCVFYWGHEGGNASGNGKLNIYVKKNDSWEVFDTLHWWEY